MNILIALTYYRPHYSGLTIYVERQARALAERGHQVTILTSRYDRSLPEREWMDGVQVVRAPVWLRVSKGVVMPSMPAWGYPLIRQADVVNLHLPQLDAAPLAVISKWMGKPVVVTYHCDLVLPSGLVNLAANYVSHLANHITAQAADVIVHNTRDYARHSPFLRRYLNKVDAILPPIRLSCVNTGDIEAFKQKYHIQPRQPIIGMAARLATEKGVEYLVEAMPTILEKYPNARVLSVGPYQNVTGEEQYARKLAPLIETLGEHWSFLGVISDVEMAAFFHTCDLTVLPSINPTESYGMVQVESIASGTPVAASDRPGVRVPVQMTRMGKIFCPGDPAALAQAVLAILDQPEQYRTGKEKLVPLSLPESVAVEYETLFRKLIKRKGDRG